MEVFTKALLLLELLRGLFLKKALIMKQEQNSSALTLIFKQYYFTQTTKTYLEMTWQRQEVMVLAPSTMAEQREQWV